MGCFMAAKLTKKQVTELLVEAENIYAALAGYKELYARLDEITASLVGQDLEGSNWSLIDNFETKMVVFKPVGVRRWELKRKVA